MRETLSHDNTGLVMIERALAHSIEHGKHCVETSFVVCGIICKHLKEIRIIAMEFRHESFDILGASSRCL